MHTAKAWVHLIGLFVLLTASMLAAGQGDLKLGYIYLDEEGNRSVYHSSYNLYEGAALSLENFRHNFANGTRLSANLRNITVNNRNLSLGLRKSGMYGVTVHHDKYRRTYSFEGDRSTRRQRTGAEAWFYPHHYLKVFAGGDFVKKQGSQVSYFDDLETGAAVPVDYNQSSFHGGIQANYGGRMLRAEYRGTKYNDDTNPERDQERSNIRLNAFLPVPRCKRLILSGGFQHFENKHVESDNKFSANTAWFGALASLPSDFSVKYRFKFDRASSDSDLVATDNLTNAFYLSYAPTGVARLTAGYQYGINDDYEDEVKSNSLYFSAWLRPVPVLELEGEYGTRTEEVKDGARLIGDEDWNRHKFSVTIQDRDLGSFALSGESKKRENDQLGSETTFDRYSADLMAFSGDYPSFDLPLLGDCKLKSLSAGYAYATGNFENATQSFEFEDNVLYGAAKLQLAEKFTAGHRFTYHRSKADLDVESFRLLFSGELEIADGFSVEALYRVQNFDDYSVRNPYDEYYTANIVEINIVKGLKF